MQALVERDAVLPELVRRQRAWETALYPRHVGRTPAEVVRGEQAARAGMIGEGLSWHDT